MFRFKAYIDATAMNLNVIEIQEIISKKLWNTFYHCLSYIRTVRGKDCDYRDCSWQDLGMRFDKKMVGNNCLFFIAAAFCFFSQTFQVWFLRQNLCTLSSNSSSDLTSSWARFWMHLKHLFNLCLFACQHSYPSRFAVHQIKCYFCIQATFQKRWLLRWKSELSYSYYLPEYHCRCPV